MTKIKAILLDDEVLVRKLIRMKLNTEELGVEIIGEYSGAAEALEVLENQQPDLIISDICMSGMDGISFSEECTRRFPGVKIIIITGYNDFEYARRCLQIGVFDYLMKPIQTTELNNTVKKAADLIRQEQEEARKRQKLQAEMEANRLILQKEYLNRLFIESIARDEAEEKLRTLGIFSNPSNPDQLQLGMIAIREGFYSFEVVEQILGEAEAFFCSEKYTYAVTDRWGRVVILYNENNDSFAELFDMFLELCANKWNYHVNASIAAGTYHWGQIHEAYLQAIDELQKRHGARSAAMTKMPGLSAMEESAKALIRLLRKGNYAEAETRIFYLLDGIDSEMKQAQNAGQIKVRTLSLLSVICQQMDLPHLFQEIEQVLSSSITIELMTRAIRFALQKMIIFEESSLKSEKCQILKRILLYIEEHLDEELDIESLVTRFGCSYSYLNRLFKQYTDKTYTELIAAERLWRIMILLNQNPDMRDLDMGMTIGIADAHYLSIWFRKMTEYSFTEYRKMLN